MNAPHVDTLESRIREELIALGLIEPQEVGCMCWFPASACVQTQNFNRMTGHKALGGCVCVTILFLWCMTCMTVLHGSNQLTFFEPDVSDLWHPKF